MMIKIWHNNFFPQNFKFFSKITNLTKITIKNETLKNLKPKHNFFS